MYKQILNPSGVVSINVIQRVADTAFIPFAPGNTDYANFKKDITNGIQLEDATGTVMTADQIKTFMETLP
jgi:hypothetical protein